MDERKPDAIIAPLDGYAEPGDDLETQSYKLFLAGQKIMGTPEVHIKDHRGLRYLCKSPHDSLFFSKTGPRAGKPRYTWEPSTDGPNIRYGYLVKEAKDEQPSN